MKLQRIMLWRRLLVFLHVLNVVFDYFWFLARNWINSARKWCNNNVKVSCFKIIINDVIQ